MTMDIVRRVRLYGLESFVAGLNFPDHVTGHIKSDAIPPVLRYPNVDAFVFYEDGVKKTLVSIFPYLVFRTKEVVQPAIGEHREASLIGLFTDNGGVGAFALVRCVVEFMD
jgi:hypothetical protein